MLNLSKAMLQATARRTSSSRWARAFSETSESVKAAAPSAVASSSDAPAASFDTMTPRAIVDELDKHIVGQSAAKRAATASPFARPDPRARARGARH